MLIAVTHRTLGLDLGSYSTRACLRTASGLEVVVENKDSMNPDNTYYAADFPSAIYPFDDVSLPVYLPDRDPGRQETSAKYAFYVFARASDELLEEYPLAHHLTERKDDTTFKNQLRKGVVGLVTVVRNAALAICKSQRYRIVKIALTIPVQWTLDFEDAYRGIILEVFHDSDESDIAFFTETESLGRYLYKYYAHDLDPDDQYNSLMFFDFGGHNMNGCLFGVARDLNQQVDNSFFSVGKPFGKYPPMQGDMSRLTTISNLQAQGVVLNSGSTISGDGLTSDTASSMEHLHLHLKCERSLETSKLSRGRTKQTGAKVGTLSFQMAKPGEYRFRTKRSAMPGRKA